MWGSHTFATSSSKVNVFVYPTDGKGREFPSKIFKAQRTLKHPAARDGSLLHGQWYSQRLEIPDDEILGVQLQASYHAKPYASCMLLLQTRSTGPYIKVKTKLTADSNAGYEWLDAFEGRADVISLKEALKQNVNIPPGIRKIYFDPEEIAEEFRVETILPETVLRPKLTTVVSSSGEKKAVRVAEGPRRIIRVRNKS
jgi:hypothetical protein